MIIKIEKIIPGRTILSLIDVTTIIRGFNLKKVSAGSIPLSGYVVDQRMYINRIRKTICETRLKIINLLTIRH